MQMALGSIGDVLKRSSCSGTAITDGDWIVSRNAHSHPANISSVRANNLENSLIQQFSRVFPPRDVIAQIAQKLQVDETALDVKDLKNLIHP